MAGNKAGLIPKGSIRGKKKEGLSKMGSAKILTPPI